MTVAGAVVGAGLGFASKVMSNILTGSKWFDGVAAATVSGAVYGGIATSPILRTTLGAHVNTIASYTSAAAESLTTEVISYAQGKEVNMSNLKCTAKKILKDTIVEGTQTCIAGKIAGKTVKTNRFWFRPKKVKSSFSGNYAKKVWKQSSVQAFVVTGSNSIRGWINKLCGK